MILNFFNQGDVTLIFPQMKYKRANTEDNKKFLQRPISDPIIHIMVDRNGFVKQFFLYKYLCEKKIAQLTPMTPDKQ